jgi:hypothetical protein
MSDEGFCEYGNEPLGFIKCGDSFSVAEQLLIFHEGQAESHVVFVRANLENGLFWL